MAVLNRVSAALSDQDIADVKTSLDSISSKLPFLISLSTAESKALPKFGDKSAAFVTKALELVKQSSDFMPRSFNVDEFGKDVELYAKLYSILQPMRKLAEKLENTYHEIGAEAYSAALLVYNNAKNNGVDVSITESMLDDLGKRFIQKAEPAEKKPA